MTTTISAARPIGLPRPQSAPAIRASRTRVFRAADRGAQCSAALRRKAPVRSRPPGPGRPRRIPQSPGSADRQGNRFPDRGPRPDRPFGERTGRLSGQQAESRRPPPGFPAPIATPRRPLLRAKAPLRPRDLRRFRRSSPEGRGPVPPRGRIRPGQRIEPRQTPLSTRRTRTCPSTRENSEEGRFPGRGRRRRLRSPYGFKVGQGDADMPNPSPSTTRRRSANRAWTEIALKTAGSARPTLSAWRRAARSGDSVGSSRGRQFCDARRDRSQRRRRPARVEALIAMPHSRASRMV